MAEQVADVIFQIWQDCWGGGYFVGNPEDAMATLTAIAGRAESLHYDLTGEDCSTRIVRECGERYDRERLRTA